MQTETNHTGPQRTVVWRLLNILFYCEHGEMGNKLTSMRSYCKGSITAGCGWQYNGWTEYAQMYVFGRTKAFLQMNAVCLNVREIAASQRQCGGITLVHAHVCARKLSHTRTHKSTSCLEEELGEPKQCSEADVITKGNTSSVSPSLCDPHEGSKSELIRVPQNGEIFRQRWQVLPASFRCDTLGRRRRWRWRRYSWCVSVEQSLPHSW